MNVKLTLSMDSSVVEKGKRYAARADKSLSRIVHDYFVMLDAFDNEYVEVPVSTKLESLVGIGVGPFDERDYRKHTMSKNE